MSETSKRMLIFINIICCLLLLSGIAQADGKWFVTEEGFRYYDSLTFFLPLTATWSGSPDDEGKVHGEGTMRYFIENKLFCTFQGNFLNGVIQGQGIMTLAGGAFYQGEFLDGTFSGKGFFKWMDGRTYEGDFANGKPNGKGIFRWKNGNVYEGDVVEGKQTGKGVLRWADGRRYEGEFFNGNIMGYGTIYGSDNKIIYQGKMPVTASQPSTGNTPPPLLQIGDAIKADAFQKSDGSLLHIEYLQKPTILWIWADFTLEKFLEEMLPVMQSVYESRGNEIQIYTVNFSSNWEKISIIMNKYGCSVPVLKSGNYLRYSHGFPCIVIIDKEGILRYREVGRMSISELNAIIDSL